MSALKTPAKSSGRVIVAYSILVIGLALSARLIFGGALFPQSSPVSVERTDQSTMLASLESTRSIPPAASTRRIESIRVGERVLAENPEIAPEERARWQEPDWQDWLHLTLQMPLPTDQEDADPPILDIEILRPEQWVVDQLGVIVAQDEDAPAAGEYDWFEFADSESALVPYSPLRPTYRYVAEMYAIAEVADAEVLGLTVDIDLPEMGAVGTAMVSAIQPCPPVKSSAGQVVTATFAHPPTRQVLDVVFEGESDAIGVTDNHLFWSEDRQAFVAIGQMESGERVVTFHGDTKRIESRLPRPGPQLVYNLEVYGEHVYFVGQQGLLVHNAYSRGKGGADSGSSDAPYNPHSIRNALETRYPGQVSSTTVPPLSAKNVGLAGTRHLNTGIVFDVRGFPIFDDVAKADLLIDSAQVIGRNYSGQMRAATRNLRGMINSGQISSSSFTASQLRAIQGGRAQIPGLTWHHHQNIGRMQLIPRKVHSKVGHIGGFEMWYGH